MSCSRVTVHGILIEVFRFKGLVYTDTLSVFIVNDILDTTGFMDIHRLNVLRTLALCRVQIRDKSLPTVLSQTPSRLSEGKKRDV